MDHQSLDLPVLANERFWFCGHAFETPSFDNAEQLVLQLASVGLILRDPASDAVLEGDVDWMSRRSVQRHFLRVTAMTFSNYQRIQRARHAAALLTDGNSILNTVFDAGYFDQSHLTRSVKQLVGMTPAALVRERPQLSFSYKQKSR